MEGPIVLRDEILDLSLPVHDEGEGRALDPADRKVVPAELLRCDGEEPRENRAPGQVHRLTRFGGPRERMVDFHEVPERPPNVPFRQGAESRPRHAHPWPDL